MTEFNLQFPLSDVRAIASRYKYTAEDASLEQTFVPFAVHNGFVTSELLYTLAHWKSPRKAKLCLQNSDTDVREITRNAFSSPSEKWRIQSLLSLHGVAWPTASVILHFAFQPKIYPVLDFRALESLGVPKVSHGFLFWIEYVEFTRLLASEANVDMRTLDRALWQFSREKDAAAACDSECR